MSRRAAGLKAWAWQRLTAIYLALFLVFLLLKLSVDPPLHYAEWRGWIGGPLINTASLLFILALLLHAWVGVRDILMDYVKPIVPRAGLMSLVILILVGCGLWAAEILIMTRVS